MWFILFSSLIVWHADLVTAQTPKSKSPPKFPAPPPPLKKNLPPTPFPPFPPYVPPAPQKLVTGPTDDRQFLLNFQPPPLPPFPPYPLSQRQMGLVTGPADDRLVTGPADYQQYTLDVYPPPPPTTPTPIPTQTLFITPSQTDTPSSGNDIENKILDSTKPFVSSVQFESGLGAIPPRQVTPSRDDTAACRAYWNVWPQGFNGSQTTHCYPLSAVGLLLVYLQDISQPFPCTGALIGPRIVLTAAHCFTHTQERLNVTNVEFTPGQFGDYKPFGSFSRGVVHTPEATFNASQDYAVVEFAEDIGKLTGWLGIEYRECGNKTYDVTVAGYSQDKSQDKMWSSQCDNTFIEPCLHGDSSGTFQHMCDTNPGTSGAPLFENNIIVGIHSGGLKSIRVNVATYISRQLMDFISIYQI